MTVMTINAHLGPLLLNAIPGLTYRIPFPVECRASFGLRGAQFAALSRGVVAIGWLSFNLWLGAKAL
jgi:NCS1 family nucleobase:cation symporter-1